ncbi:MAG TPA: hypothetical protein VGB62_00485 [Allosphingosinicella sp.]
MIRTLASAFLALASLAAMPAPAAAAGAHYRAELVSSSGESRLMAGDLVWRCSQATCTAAKSNSRPAIECAAFVRKAGAVRSFSAAGEALSPEQLEKCNARAR